MKNFDCNALGVREMNAFEMEEANGGGLRDWLIGKLLDGAVKLMTIYAEAYVNYSMETGGKYVIHHAY